MSYASIYVMDKKTRKAIGYLLKLGYTIKK